LLLIMNDLNNVTQEVVPPTKSLNMLNYNKTCPSESLLVDHYSDRDSETSSSDDDRDAPQLLNEALGSVPIVVETRKISLLKALLVGNYSWTDKSLEKLQQLTIPPEDLLAIEQAVDTFICAYIVCVMSVPSLANVVDKMTMDKNIQKARIDAVVRAATFVQKQYLVDRDHTKECYWADYWKYKTASFYAYFLEQSEQMPPRLKDLPDDLPSVILGGIYGRVVYRLKHRSEEGFQLLVETINYIKKGMPSVPSDFVQSKVDKTADHLTAPNKEEESVVINFYNTKVRATERKFDQNDAVYEAIRTTEELFRWCPNYNYADWTKPFVGSTASCYDSNTLSGGQATYVAANAAIDLRFDPVSDFGLNVKIHDVDCCLPLSESYGFESRESDQFLMDTFLGKDEPTFKTKGLSYDTSILNKTFEDIYWNTWFKAVNEPNYAIPVGLSEPLKVRVIMKGRASKYFCMRPFQKWMHGWLRQQPNLVAIGMPITEVFVNEFFGCPEEDTEFVNGDYQQSTNLIFSRVSEAIGNKLVDIFLDKFSDIEKCQEKDPNFSRHLREMVIDCLIHHIVVTKCKTGDKDKSGRDIMDVVYREQKTGQSMGSPVSFPVLCIANLAGARKAMEHRLGRRLRLGHSLKVLVNGDDVTLKSYKGIFPIWCGIMKCFGLYTSPGKTFPSKSSDKQHFIMLNSMRFQYDREWFVYKLIPFINFGILKGIKKSSSNEIEAKSKSAYDLYSLQSDLLKRACPSLSEVLNCLFIKMNKAIMCEFRLPFYLPRWMGGLGLKPPIEVKISDWDLRMATCIKMNFAKYEPRLPTRETPWWMWSESKKFCDSLIAVDSALVPQNYVYGKHPVYGDFVELGDSFQTFRDSLIVSSFYSMISEFWESFPNTSQFKKDNPKIIIGKSDLNWFDLTEDPDVVKLEQVKFRKAIRHNEMMFKKVSKLVTKYPCSYPPMDIRDLEPERKEFFLPTFRCFSE
jgi:hypothetical protein